MNWKVRSTIEPVIARRDAYFYFCLSVAFSAFSFFGSPHLYLLVGGVFFLITGLLFLFVIVFPERSMRGIRILDDGFEYANTFRLRELVQFQDIYLIEASSFESPETGERDIMLRICSASSTVVVFERDLLRTGLLDRLEAISGFDQTRMVEARNIKSNWYDFFSNKYIVVFVR